MGYVCREVGADGFKSSQRRDVIHHQQQTYDLSLLVMQRLAGALDSETADRLECELLESTSAMANRGLRKTQQVIVLQNIVKHAPTDRPAFQIEHVDRGLIHAQDAS